MFLEGWLALPVKVAVAALLAGTLATADAKPVVPPEVGCGGSFVPGLDGVSSASSSDAWAVGQAPNPVSGVSQTLIEHWSGTRFRRIASPDRPSHGNFLFGVAATSSSNAWAVGSYNINLSQSHALIEHWNGRRWSTAASPDPGGSAFLYGVAARSSSNAWAVGESWNGAAYQTLIEHWNGARWQLVSSPNPGGWTHLNVLDGIAIVSSSNAWAVGCYSKNARSQYTLVLHWNGRRWQRVTSPSPGSPNALNGIGATSPYNAWAVGEYWNGTADHTLVLHWNGRAWHKVASPDPATSLDNNSLFGVTAKSSHSAWAVGAYGNGTVGQTLIIRWNGTAWRMVTSPDPGGTSNMLSGIAAGSSGNAWAVGSYNTDPNPARSLTLHWDGVAWR